MQSLDGQLSFFEGEAISFKRFLPNFLLPGPLAYVPDTDSFVTANSSMVLESYKFSVRLPSAALLVAGATRGMGCRGRRGRSY